MCYIYNMILNGFKDSIDSKDYTTTETIDTYISSYIRIALSCELKVREQLANSYVTVRVSKES